MWMKRSAAFLALLLCFDGCITYSQETPSHDSNESNDTNVSSPAVITKTTPDQNETNVSLTTPINVTFDKVLNGTTLVKQNIGFYKVIENNESNDTNTSGGTISVLVSGYGITPYTTGPWGFNVDYNTTQGLETNTTYEVNITTAVQDANGDPLKAQGFSFTTGTGL